MAADLSRPEQWALEGSEGGPLRVSRIERDLAAMWKSATSRTGGTAVSRACASTLVILCRAGADRAADSWVQEISRRHPCRAIVMETGCDAAVRLEASAGAVCHLRPGGEGLICGEVIRVTARAGADEALPSVARSLAVGGLPLVLLAPDPATRDGIAFEGMAADADVVIVESRETADLRLDGADAVRDLAWSAGSGLRRALATAGCDDASRAVLEAPEEIRIAHDAPAAAVLLAGWIATRLRMEPAGPESDGAVAFRGPTGVEGRFRFRPPEEEGEASITVGGGAGNLEARIAAGETAAVVTTPGGSRRVALRSRTPADRVIDEIHQHEPSPFYVAALAPAGRIARALEEGGR